MRDLGVPFRYKDIESSRRVRLAELLQQEEEDLQRDCTFKPQINQHPSHQNRGEFLAEAQLRERKKRLQMLLAAESDATDDDVVRSLRSAISGASQTSPANTKSARRSPATPQFSPAFSLAASIVGANGIEVSNTSSSVAARGRHEDPDLKGGIDTNVEAAAGAVEKVCALFDAKKNTRMCSRQLMCRSCLRLLQSCLRVMTMLAMRIFIASRSSKVEEVQSGLLLLTSLQLLLMCTAQLASKLVCNTRMRPISPQPLLTLSALQNLCIPVPPLLLQSSMKLRLHRP